MRNDHYASTASTTIREIAHLSASILEVLDRYGSEYFDYCSIESELLQKRLEVTIRDGAIRLVEALDTM